METITKSESIKNIAKALVEFHKNVGKIKKGETNPFFKSKYANLSAILDVIDAPLQETGLSYVQFPVGKNQLTTLLMHSESGEWIQGTYEMTPTKNDPQGQGSVITYQRRYALGGVLGLNIDEDDDGAKGSKPVPGVKLGVSAPKKVELIVSEPEAIESVEVAISDAVNIEMLQTLLLQIPKSKKLTAADKDKYLGQVREKVMTFDPIA